MIAFASVERKLIQAMFTSNDALRKWKIRFSIFVGFPNVVTEIEKGRHTERDRERERKKIRVKDKDIWILSGS